MKIAIIGFAREGKSVLKFLKASPEFLGAKIEILDKKSGRNYLKNLECFDTVFRSPGIPYNLPELKKARHDGVGLSSATKLFFDNCPTKNLIGITGTKGKGTTATLLYKIMKTAGVPVFLAGNIGKPALDTLPKLKKNSWVILELSSFQLQDLKTSPRVAVVLDIFPDHQDKHLSLAEYYASKANIAKHQKRGDKIFFFSDNKLSSWVARQSGAKRISVNENNFGLFRPEDLKIIGNHNFKNAVMAATVALKLGIHAKTIVKTVKSFRGLPHRLQLVHTTTTKTPKVYSHILKNMRIDFYNDSAAVNPGATVAALKTFSGKNLILIAGGLERGLDYSDLARAVKKYAKAVILFGENKKAIARAVRHQTLDIRHQNKPRVIFTKTLKDATSKAYRYASTLITNNSLLVTVLFSPASASFDMFKNYEERGEEFIKIVRKIKNWRQNG